jgi:hypothetical protein
MVQLIKKSHGIDYSHAYLLMIRRKIVKFVNSVNTGEYRTRKFLTISRIVLKVAPFDLP